MSNKAVILLSGGLDSSTCLAIAKSNGYECYAISFNYGQRHVAELNAARRVASFLGVKKHIVMPVGLGALGGSSLTDITASVPEFGQEKGVPSTYVPARNTVFLSLALAYAEVLKANHIFIGVTAVDYSGYPDCRPEYMQAWQTLAHLATNAGLEGERFHFETPLIALSKSEIIQQGALLGLDYRLTVSCYQADEQGRACGTCDSCHYRREGFQEAGLEDCTNYQ